MSASQSEVALTGRAEKEGEEFVGERGVHWQCLKAVQQQRLAREGGQGQG